MLPLAAGPCVLEIGAYSSSSFPSVGLCFSCFLFLCGTTFPAGGAPMRSRASSLTACTAPNRFTFFLRAISREPRPSCCHSLYRAEHAIILFHGRTRFFRREHPEEAGDLKLSPLPPARRV